MFLKVGKTSNLIDIKRLISALLKQKVTIFIQVTLF